jgi:hypothetical protein
MNLKAQVMREVNRLAAAVPLLACVGSLLVAAILCKVMLGRFLVYDLYSEDSIVGWFVIVPVALICAWMALRNSTRNKRKP